MKPNTLVWMNGESTPIENAKISVRDHGLLYGDGVFEGMRFYDRRVFRLAEHLERLAFSARAIGLKIPYTLNQLQQACESLAYSFDLKDGYLRLVVTRGEGELGLDPSTCPVPTVFIMADTLALVSEAVREAGAKVIIASTRRLASDCVDPRIKSLNYLNGILARMEANAAGAHEAILLNGAGRVAEGSADNVFIVKRGCLLTPPVIDGALEGITRNEILLIAERLGIQVRVESLAPYDLYTADECFLTGSGAELIPVSLIDGRAVGVCPGPVYRKLSQAYEECVRSCD